MYQKTEAAVKPLSLSDCQLRFLIEAAKAVPVHRREAFLQQVAAHLAAEPTDQAVQAALNAQLDRLSHSFRCDTQEGVKK
jgi:hypothetical protein